MVAMMRRLPLGNFSELSPVSALELFIITHRIPMDNSTLEEDDTLPPIFPLNYRIIASVLHVLIFIVGFLGNVLVIVVVYRTKSLHVPTYSYLVSLALADVLVITTTLPEAIVSYHLYAGQWIFGQVGCSGMIFLSFLAINVSSMSILAFTVERFIAICMPMRAKSMCTLKRARIINISIWVVSALSSCPWLGLTLTHPHPDFPDMDVCSFRFAHDKYAYIFGSDILIFYIIPLFTAAVLYFKIAQTLMVPPLAASANFTSVISLGGSNCHLDSLSPAMGPRNGSRRRELTTPDQISSDNHQKLRRSRKIKVLRMLFIIMVTFAICWLPYRAMSLYNAFASEPFYDKWFMLFAKSCIFINSSINPILYNAMSPRFHRAARKLLGCGPRKRPLHRIDEEPA